MVSSGANVVIWCYHVMLSSGMITHPFLFFLKTSLTQKKVYHSPLLARSLYLGRAHRISITKLVEGT
jgi:hypothetical protein